MTPGPNNLTLELTRVLPAVPARVYAALTDPHELSVWWGPRGFTIPSVEVDLRVGGSYRIAMQPPDGDVFHLSGVFREIEPPARLAYTFRWEEPDPDDRETNVTLSLRGLNESTELLMRQGPFATEARRALHRQGWTDSLDKLEFLVSPRASDGASPHARSS